MDRQTDRWTDGRREEWIDRWMIEVETEGHVSILHIYVWFLQLSRNGMSDLFREYQQKRF